MDSATVERFEANRSRLASLAYRLLGSAADAEDAVQDAFLRWHAADREHIKVPEAWLTKVVINLSLDRLRSAMARRERAVGDWLPETLMERLAPVERAVYVLREAFSYSHAEIAEILDITESASQQHAHRARRRIAAERIVSEIDRPSARRVVEAFVDAASSGRTERLVALLTDDATAVADGAGQAGRLLRYSAPDRIAAAMRAAFKPTPAKRRLVGGSPSMHAGIVNGSPAIIAEFADRVVGVVVLEVRDDKIAVVRGIADPDRLRRLTEQWRRHDHDAPLTELW
jgi:RNA polymerase sigma-70 factor (ECF subfamily)